MTYSQAGLEELAERILCLWGQPVTYPPVPVDGAGKAAELIGELL